MLSKPVTKNSRKNKLNSLNSFWCVWSSVLVGNKSCFRILVFLLLWTSWFLSITTWASIVVAAQTTETSQITINVEGSTNAGIQPVNDQATTTQGQTVRIDVSNNDLAINSFLDRTSISIVTPPSNGTAVVVGFFVDYTPNSGFVGQDVFTYRICNTQFDCGQAVVTLQVTGSNSNNNNNNIGGGGSNNNTGNNQNQNNSGNSNSGNNNSNNNPQPNNNLLPPGPLPITGGVTGLSLFLGFGLLVLVMAFLYRKRNGFRIIFSQQSELSNSKTNESHQTKTKTEDSK